jgi:short-subunit dehydrogenase
MRTILILGATSTVGAALSEQFAKGNRLILSGRNQAKLDSVANRCTKAGSVAIKIVATDLAQTIHPIIVANSEWAIDLIIDAASAASIKRDTDITPHEIRNIIQSDILSHLDIFQQLAQMNKKHPDIAYISTVLAVVKTPDREIYSAAKRLVEIYLEKLNIAEPIVRVLIFRIGKLIDPKQDSSRVKAMAERVHHEFSTENISTIYGMSGHILMFLNSFHPAVLNFVVKAQRALRNK